MQIEVGDTVQLTATVLFGLQENAPEVFAKLQAAGRTGGEVVSMEGNHILVDMGEIGPLSIEIEGDDHQLALQLVKKAGSDTLAEPYEARPAACASHPFLMPMSPFMMRNQTQPADEVPARVRIAQWVMTQFLQLKQYGIVQDLNRVDDADAGQPDPTDGDDWKRGDKQLRPVRVELSAPEEQLYNASLRKVQDWITDTPVTRHPECCGGCVTETGDEQDDSAEPTDAAQPEETAEDQGGGQDGQGVRHRGTAVGES